MKVMAAALVILFAAGVQEEGISGREFQERRAGLFKRCGGEGAVIVEAGKFSGGKSNDANTPKLDFRYFAGVQIPNGILAILGGEDQVFLFADGDLDEIRKTTGIRNVMKTSAFKGFAKDVLSAVKKFYLKRRSRIKGIIEEAAEDAAFPSTIDGLATQMRVIKTESELACMRKAAKITCQAHKAAMRACKPAMNESEIQKIIETTYKKEGATGIAFPSICGSGKNGTVLHYMSNKMKLPDDSLIVMDIGAEFHGYAADITRTIPTGGKFRGEQKKAYECVLAAQKAAEKILKPGVTWRDLELAARQVFVDRRMTKWSYGHARDFSVRHGLGHYVGLHVHDSGSYRARMEEGMVITIEPGYYDKDNAFGIRIEDTYILTRDGAERISRFCPREIDEIEKLMAEGD